MTYSYNENPFTENNLTGSKTDALRLILRITSTPWEMSDEELQYFIDTETGSMKWIAYKCAQSIANKYANFIDRSMGDLSLSESQKFAHWQSVAQEMKIAATTGSTQSPYPIASCNGPKKFSVGGMDMYGSSGYYDPLRGDI
jgi:hypothetical protein